MRPPRRSPVARRADHLDGRAGAASSLVGVEAPERRDGAGDGDDLADARPPAAARRRAAPDDEPSDHAPSPADAPTHGAHCPVSTATDDEPVRTRSTATSPSAAPPSRRARATAGPAARSRTGSSSTARALIEPPEHVRQRTAVERGEPEVRDERAREHGRRGEPAAAGARTAVGSPGGSSVGGVAGDDQATARRRSRSGSRRRPRRRSSPVTAGRRAGRR